MAAVRSREEVEAGIDGESGGEVDLDLGDNDGGSGSGDEDESGVEEAVAEVRSSVYQRR